MEDRNLRMFGDEEGDKEGGEGHPLAITIVNVAYPSGQPASQPTLSLPVFPIKPDSALEAYRPSPVPNFSQWNPREKVSGYTEVGKKSAVSDYQ